MNAVFCIRKAKSVRTYSYARNSVITDDDEDLLPSVIPDEEDLLPSVKTESLLSSAYPEDIVVVVIDDWRLLSSGCPLGVVVWRLIELPKLLDLLAVLLEDDGWDVDADQTTIAYSCNHQRDIIICKFVCLWWAFFIPFS